MRDNAPGRSERRDAERVPIDLGEGHFCEILDEAGEDRLAAGHLVDLSVDGALVLLDAVPVVCERDMEVVLRFDHPDLQTTFSFRCVLRHVHAVSGGIEVGLALRDFPPSL